MTATRLQGRYRLDKLLGAGAFASVHQAHDEQLDDVVAVKILGHNHAVNPDIRQRFVVEGQTLRRLSSPHLVGVHDLAEAEDGRPFLVLELCDRGTLRQRAEQARQGGWTPGDADAVTVALALAAAIATLDDAGVVHRDLTPANVLITTRAPHSDATIPASTLMLPGERLVVADLGFCKDLAVGSGISATGGTQGFQPPEQHRVGATVDVRSDLWAAAAVIAWVLTAATHTDPAAAAAAITDAGISRALAHAITRPLAPDPDDRPADAAAWIGGIVAACPQVSISPASLAVAHVPRPRRRRTRTVAAAAAAGLAAVIAAAAIALPDRSNAGNGNGALGAFEAPIEPDGPQVDIAGVAFAAAAVAPLLADAEQQWRGALAEGDLTVHRDARCYLSRSDSAAYNPWLRCGPVQRPGVQGNWDTLRFTPVAADMEFDAYLDIDDVDPRYTQLVDGEALERADGAVPPDPIVLDPPALQPDVQEWVAVPAGVDLDSPDNGSLYALDVSVHIEGVAVAERFGEGGDALIAADGQRLVLIDGRVEAGVAGAARYRDNGDFIDFTIPSPTQLVIGDDTAIPRDLTDWWPQGQVLLLSVPADVDEVALEVTEFDRTQRLDLLTGELDTPPIAGLQAAEAPVVNLGVDYQHTATAESPDDAWDVTARFAIADAGRYAYDRDLGWAPDGHTWLYVRLAGYDLDNRQIADDYGLDRLHLNTSLRIDGQTLQPADDGPPRNPVFAIPTATADITFVADPFYTASNTFQGPDARAEFPQVTVDFQI